MNTLHPQTSTQEAATELDELYGRYMAAVNANGGEGYGEHSLEAKQAWQEYKAAQIYKEQQSNESKSK
jgi:hypothetical protein